MQLPATTVPAGARTAHSMWARWAPRGRAGRGARSIGARPETTLILQLESTSTYQGTRWKTFPSSHLKRSEAKIPLYWRQESITGSKSTGYLTRGWTEGREFWTTEAAVAVVWRGEGGGGWWPWLLLFVLFCFCLVLFCFVLFCFVLFVCFVCFGPTSLVGTKIFFCFCFWFSFQPKFGTPSNPALCRPFSAPEEGEVTRLPESASLKQIHFSEIKLPSWNWIV